MLVIRILLFPLPALIAGAMTYYVWQLGAENQRLQQELAGLASLRSELQDQQALNTRQRLEFEGQVTQLQGNLRDAQSQMSALSSALQEARELIEPGAPAPSADATQP